LVCGLEGQQLLDLWLHLDGVTTIARAW
jgi:hypothetical protein